MKRFDYQLHLIFSPTKSGQDLAPGIPEKTGTGCYGISGPVPYAVLDKNSILKELINSVLNI